MKWVILVAFVMLASCQSGDQKYSSDECSKLAMKKYKGIPRASHNYDKHCQDVPHDYTLSKCQKAFHSLLGGASKEQLKQMYGNKILNCFTGEQLKKWSK